MALYSTVTRHGQQQVLDRAKAFFGPGNVGLEMEEQGPCCLYFSGGGGHVRVTVAAADNETSVELETREWDYQVQEFMRRL